jgi:general L-amino acid transport system substrate-binding protein
MLTDTFSTGWSSKLRKLVLLGLLVLAWSQVVAAQANTISEIRKRGHLNCGVSQGIEGFSSRNVADEWSGFDVDLCRAVAAAILGKGGKSKFIPLSAEQRFEALREKQIDILSRNTTWTMKRDIELGLAFPAVVYYDGQGFMLPASLVIDSLAQLSGAKICILSGTTAETNIRAYFELEKLDYSLVASATRAEMLSRYEGGECDAVSADRSALHGDRLRMKEPANHVVMPNIISKEPLGPAVRDDDRALQDVVRWTISLLVTAEEAQLQRALITNSDAALSALQELLLQRSGALSSELGLSESWSRDVIGAVGNYGEIYDRNLGPKSPLGIPRGNNALWYDGGLLYAPPMR